jgi:hypothetical protein
MNKEKTIQFRIDNQLFTVIQAFAKEKGYENISELMRELIIMHFMGLMLGYFQNKNLDNMTVEILDKFKNLQEKNVNMGEKDIKAGDTIKA